MSNDAPRNPETLDGSWTSSHIDEELRKLKIQFNKKLKKHEKFDLLKKVLISNYDAHQKSTRKSKRKIDENINDDNDNEGESEYDDENETESDYPTKKLRLTPKKWKTKKSDKFKMGKKKRRSPIRKPYMPPPIE